MFEPEGVKTFLGFAASEYEAFGDGVCEGAIAPTLSKFIVPFQYETERHYWKVGNLIGRGIKLGVYALAIKVFGVATGGLI